MEQTTKQNLSSNDATNNAAEELTLELLALRHDALARYVGVPCYVDPDVVTNNPAIIDEQGIMCDGYAGYEVALPPFVGDFNEVVFSAASNGDNVVCGYIVDKDGKVEAVVKCNATDGAMVKLPLTSNSCKLYATMPNKDGKPASENIIIKFYADGLHTDYQRMFTEILSRVIKLEKEFKMYKQISGTDSNIPEE